MGRKKWGKHFKYLSGFLSCLFLIFSFSGCFIDVNEELPESETLNFQTKADFNCLSKAADFMDSYVSGNAQKKEIIKFWGCASKSIDSFTENTKGKENGKYKLSELKKFLENYFLDGEKLPSKLVYEIMNLKRSLLGGSASVITKGDLIRVKRLMTLLKIEMIELRTFFPVSPDHWNTFPETKLKVGLSSLMNAGIKIGGFFGKSGSKYEISRIKELLTAVQSYYNSDFDWIIKSLPLVTAIKQLVIGPGRKFIRANEWEKIFETGAHSFGLYMRFLYLNENYGSWSSGEGKKHMVELLRGVRIILENSVKSNKEAVLPLSYFFDVIDEIDPENFKPLSVDTLKTMMRAVVRRILGGVVGPIGGKKAQGLTSFAINRGWAAVTRWSIGQDYLEKLFRELDSTHEWDSVIHSSDRLLSVPPEDIFYKNNLSDTQQKVIIDLRGIITRFPMFFRPNFNEMYFAPLRENRRHSFYDLSQLNWIRQVLFLTMPGYSVDTTDTKVIYWRGVPPESFQLLFGDVETLLKELYILDPRNNNQWLQRYYETSLFTYTSNGDRYVDIDEGTQFIAFLISNQVFGSRVHSTLVDSCPTGSNDVFDEPTIEPLCYRREFDRRYREFFRNLPKMLAFYEKIRKRGLRDDFFKRLETAGRWDGYSNDKYFESGDTQVLTAIFQYVEGLFGRYDRDNSGALELNEAQMAFPVYKGFLKDYSPFENDNELEALFTYMLRYGSPPTPDLKGVLHFWSWRQIRRFWSTKATRSDVFMIFSTINQISD